MSNSKALRRIGGIYACIAGDRSYSTSISVFSDGDCFEVRLDSASPLGGMDGDQTAVNSREVLARARTPVDLIKALREAFTTADGGTVARYGKPTKNFRWLIDGQWVSGLNQSLAERARRSVLGGAL